MTGPSPLYNPLSPSSTQIRFKLDAMPLYNSPPGTPNPGCSTCSVLICACNLVFTTSSGQVIKLVRMPAHAPATAFLEFGVRDWRIVLAGVDEGEGILKRRRPSGDVGEAIIGGKGTSREVPTLEEAKDGPAEEEEEEEDDEAVIGGARVLLKELGGTYGMIEDVINLVGGSGWYYGGLKTVVG